MKTIISADDPAVNPAELDRLDAFAATDISDDLREVLQTFVSALREGDDVIAFDASEQLTPSQAARRLKMSRTHLYSLLDDGTIPSVTVGRDRRISMRDLVAFEGRRDAERRELAERFAHRDQTRRGAVDEIADLL